MISMSLLGACLIYALAAAVVLLLSYQLALRWLGHVPRALMATLLVLLLTPTPTDADFQNFAPASVTVLFELLSHSRLGVLRALLSLGVTATLVSALLAWVLPARRSS